MKIILATDFSKASEIAEKYALEWSKKFIAELHLIHCFTLPIVDPMMPVGYIDIDYKPIMESLEQKLANKERQFQENGVSTHTHLFPGDLLFGINEVIKEIGKDDTFLILGKSSKYDFLDNILGSTSVSLLNNLEIPVLVIPEDCNPKLPKRVSYATELEYDEKPMLQKSSELCKILHADFNLCHITLDYEMDIVPDGIFIEEIKNITNNQNIHIEFIKADSLREGIQSFITTEKSDLLILTSHKRNFFDQLIAPSNSKKILENIQIPMLIFHF